MSSTENAIQTVCGISEIDRNSSLLYRNPLRCVFASSNNKEDARSTYDYPQISRKLITAGVLDCFRATQREADNCWSIGLLSSYTEGAKFMQSNSHATYQQ
ncbi:uncharacterized protein LOC114942968 [Nylanderia fulva]|uniref:uncharacterized protein LOC114942968 n=1 Tax=Nylanderia fulva TaxID=613905 RepID=UPI0010FAE083|nr:uncharacterized protein LOC114942968 [Nylanderia fulva]